MQFKEFRMSVVRLNSEQGAVPNQNRDDESHVIKRKPIPIIGYYVK